MNILKINNDKPSIEDLECLKNALDKLFTSAPGSDFHVEDDENEIVAYEYIINKLQRIDNYRNRYINERLASFKAYAWICKNTKFKDGLNNLYGNSKDAINYQELALRMLKESGFTGTDEKLQSMTFSKKSILYLNSGKRPRTHKTKNATKLIKLKIYIEITYPRIWQKEHLIWMLLPFVINYLKNDSKEYPLEVKNSDIQSLSNEIESLYSKCSSLSNNLEFRDTGISLACSHLRSAISCLSVTMPESILKRDSKTSKQKKFVIQVTRALIDDGGVTLSDGILLDLLPMPKYRLDSLDYDDFEPIFEKKFDSELKPEQLEAPIAVIMNSAGKLSRKTLNKIEVFDDFNKNELSLLDCAILDVWTNNDSFLGIRRINQKYNHKNVGKFITHFLTICDYISGLEESLLLKEEDILKIIDHEVMAHAIEIEIKKRLRKHCNVPRNIKEEMSILTII